MLQNAPREHFAIFFTFFKVPFVFKTFALPVFEWPRKTGFTVQCISIHEVWPFLLKHPRLQWDIEFVSVLIALKC